MILSPETLIAQRFETSLSLCQSVFSIFSRENADWSHKCSLSCVLLKEFSISDMYIKSKLK